MEMADADVSFASSIGPILQSLPAKKKKKGIAKIEIQQVLMKFDFDD